MDNAVDETRIFISDHGLKSQMNGAK
jgi:hypothetical protein